MNGTIRKNKNFLHTHTFTGYGTQPPYLYNKTNDGVVDGIKRMHTNFCLFLNNQTRESFVL